MHPNISLNVHINIRTALGVVPLILLYNVQFLNKKPARPKSLSQLISNVVIVTARSVAL